MYRRAKSQFGIPAAGGRGQALVLSIAVMFLLAFLGAIFVAMIARNLFRAERSGDVLSAQYLAEAGIRYADRQLTMGEDGADWRPEPPMIPNPGDPYYDDFQKDPDRRWLDLPVQQRFSRFSYGNGRFLLRITYDPKPDDPLSHFLKIESIGRVGNLNDFYVCPYGDTKSPNPGTCPNHGTPAVALVPDPTVLTEYMPKLRRELVAYKPIGVTDYLRFITNREKRHVVFELGAPPGYTATYGQRPDAANPQGLGGPIRVNGDLRWYGTNVIYLRGVPSTDAAHPSPIDTVEVAGRIYHEEGAEVLVKTIIGGTEIEWDGTDRPSVTPSDDPDFVTAQGFYRDGYDGPDSQGYPRQIVRLESPLVDLEDPATNFTRYRQLTMNSGRWRNDQGEWFNAGRFGWGAGIYIDNRTDVQYESESLFGGFSLRSDWIKPNNDMTAYWRGPYYIPPGVQIILLPDDINNDDKPDIILIRTDTTRRGAKRVWTDETGKPLYGTGQTLIRSYPENGIIFAEGNIRIKGMLPPNTQLTVVSNATIYIEGNILKYRAPGEIEPDPRSAIALLAKDYVCVNTTQFVSILTDTGPASIGSDAQNGRPPYHLIISPDPTTNFRTEFSFGEADYLLDEGFKPMLFVRHAAQEGSAYINMWINAGTAGGLYDFLGQDAFTGGVWPAPPAPSNFPTFMYGLNDFRFGGMAGVGVGTNFEQRFWNLPVAATYTEGKICPDVGSPNRMEVGLDQVILAQHNYLMSGFTIQPLDIHIEAIILAQDKSFFIIPGPWFNPDPRDSDPARPRPPGTMAEFPLYGQPLDIKITINGAITENKPAARSEVEAWMVKWGKIPDKYGTSSIATKHPGEGLTFVYDPLLRRPLYEDPPGSAQLVAIRKDNYGRPLPIAPKLPVCTGLVYFGEPI